MVITTKRLFISVAIVIVFLLVSIFLQQVFFGAIILSQTFSLGFITIHYYGILMAAAVAAAFYLAIRRAPKYGVDVKQAEDLLFWLIIFGFIGARLYHVLSSISYYWIHPLDTLKVWNGGLSIYGALLGGLFILWCYFKIHNSKFPPSADRPGAGIILNLLDWLAPSVVLGQIIGRFWLSCKPSMENVRTV
jgi:phosphatidylglycerol:prolipoprotein diacylglycerol transferase